MRCFSNIAVLIKDARLNHKNKFSQSELSNLLGYKNGQFISNVERGLCNIPLKMLSRVCNILELSPDQVKEAILKDQVATLDNYLALSSDIPSENNESVSSIVGSSDKTTWINNSTNA